MTANDFFEHFATLADAPGGVPKLRELILQLAVRGKLVPQYPYDEPASELLNRIQSEKKRLIDVAQIRDQQSLPENHLAIASFPLPPGWRCVTLADIVYLRSGITIATGDEMAEGSIPYLKVADLGLEANAMGIVTSSRFVSDKYSGSIIESGSIVFPKRGGAIATNRKRLAQIGIVCDSNLMTMKPFLSATTNYILLWFRSIDLWKLNSGTSVPQINNKDIYPLSFPLPPLAEQKRIVARVDRLMALCDALEAQQQARHAVRSRLHATLLGNLQTAANAADFARAWQRLRDHFAELFTPGEAALDAVAQLRQTILQLAVRGKLVPQDANGEPGTDLLKRVQVDKERLIKTGMIKDFELLPIGPSDAPFPIPESWKWIRLGELIESMKNGIYKPSRFYSNEGTACVRMYNIQDGNLDLSKLQRLDLTESEIEQYRLEPRDLIVNRVNSRELVGKAAVVGYFEEPLVFEAMNIRVRMVEKYQCPDFVNLLFRTSQVRRVFEVEAKQAIGQASINQPQVAGIVAPLPPLVEQQRIVTKVQQLMAQCDALETSLKAAATVSERWSAAAARGLLNAPSR